MALRALTDKAVADAAAVAISSALPGDAIWY